MSTFPPLHELQHLLSRLIRAPQGVDEGLREMVESGELVAPDLRFAIEPNDRMRAEERLDVYAGMYFYRLQDALAEDHARTRERIGDAHFHNLVTDYLLEHPPSQPSLREAGDALPAFAAGHPLVQIFPALGDVVQLERARSCTFDARDATPLVRERFLAASAEDPDHFQFQLIPAAQVLCLDPRALAWWRDPKAPEPAGSNDPQHVLVWRKGFSVFHRPCVEEEARCLDVLRSSGITLPELAELLLVPDASAERTSERFAALLELWLENELLSEAPARARA